MARILGKPPSTVYSWLYRERIPDQNHTEILRRAEERGIQLTRDDFYRH